MIKQFAPRLNSCQRRFPQTYAAYLERSYLRSLIYPLPLLHTSQSLLPFQSSFPASGLERKSFLSVHTGSCLECLQLKSSHV